MDTPDKVQGAHLDRTMSMDSVDIAHCFPGQSPWTPWTMSMDFVESLDNMSMDTQDKVQLAHSDYTISMASVDIVHFLPGEFPWSPQTMSTDSVDSVDIVH